MILNGIDRLYGPANGMWAQFDSIPNHFNSMRECDSCLIGFCRWLMTACHIQYKLFCWNEISKKKTSNKNGNEERENSGRWISYYQVFRFGREDESQRKNKIKTLFRCALSFTVVDMRVVNGHRRNSQ